MWSRETNGIITRMLMIMVSNIVNKLELFLL